VRFAPVKRELVKLESLFTSRDPDSTALVRNKNPFDFKGIEYFVKC
jgi:hypothetical protein